MSCKLARHTAQKVLYSCEKVDLLTKIERLYFRALVTCRIHFEMKMYDSLKSNGWLSENLELASKYQLGVL